METDRITRVGKIADFVIHDCDDYRELGYFFGIEHAWRVYLRRKKSHRLHGSGVIAATQKAVDAPLLVIYYPLNTGKEVILIYMSSNHSEVAAA